MDVSYTVDYCEKNLQNLRINVLAQTPYESDTEFGQHCELSFMCFLWSQEIIKSHRNAVHCVTLQKQDDLETATDWIQWLRPRKSGILIL